MQVNTLIHELNTASDRINKKNTIEEASGFDNSNLFFPIKPSLDVLLSKITEQGKLLLESPVYDNLIRYKDMVKNFIQEVISELYVIKKQTTSQSTVQKTGQKNVYFFVEKVNNNLISLTESVLQRQAKPLAIASKLSLIHGLLMDMYI